MGQRAKEKYHSSLLALSGLFVPYLWGSLPVAKTPEWQGCRSQIVTAQKLGGGKEGPGETPAETGEGKYLHRVFCWLGDVSEPVARVGGYTGTTSPADGQQVQGYIRSCRRALRLGVGSFQFPGAPPNRWLRILSCLWGENIAISSAPGDRDLWPGDTCQHDVKSPFVSPAFHPALKSQPRNWPRPSEPVTGHPGTARAATVLDGGSQPGRGARGEGRGHSGICHVMRN